MRQLFTLGSQNARASASASVFPVNIQGWFPLGLTGLISLLFSGVSRVFSSTTKASVLQCSAFFYSPTLTSIRDYWKTIVLTIQTFVGKVMSLLFHTLSKFAFSRTSLSLEYALQGMVAMSDSTGSFFGESIRRMMCLIVPCDPYESSTFLPPFLCLEYQ